MPRIDPHQLLACLNPLLASNGGIKSSAEVIRLASLMEKYSKKLVSKCIYIQILKCTDSELLGQFMAAGGWNLVHFWLKDGADTLNWPLVQEILEMLLLCPVDGNRLKSNHTPKIVKNLSLSCVQNGVRILSNKLVEQWLKIAHQEKQQLQTSPVKNSGQLNGNINGTIANNNNLNVDNENNMLVDDSLVVKKDEKENELQTDALDGTEVSKKSSENTVKYKISNKDTGLKLSIKRSISPSIDEKEKVIKSPDVKVKSESRKSPSSDRDKKKSSSSHKSSSSSSSKSSHKDKERSSSHKSRSSSSSNKDKHRSSSSSSSKHSNSSSSSKHREKSKKDIEKEQAEKDKETLSFLTPLSSHKLQRIPKRQHPESNENKDTNDLEPSSKAAKTSGEPIERKKPSISIEVRKGDKPKTVKTLNSQFRNHGLAEEPPPPPSRKALTKKLPTTTATPTLSINTSSVSSAPIKSITSPTLSKKIEKALETDVPERVGGVKLIKPKPMLVESTGFLDALETTVLSKKEPKKRKRVTSTSSSSRKEEVESPKIEAKPLKFYKDTLEESIEEEKTNGITSPSKDKDIEGKSENVKDDEKAASPKNEKESEIKEEEEVPEEKRPPGVGTGPDGPPGVLVDPTRKRRVKRSIRWRPDTELTDIRYFELDENERANVTKNSFTEQKAMEHHAERNAFMLGRKLHSDDIMVEQISWRPLIVVDNVPEINHGYKSREIQVQLEREKNTLQDLFYHQADSASEPDFEHFDPSDPIHIPFDDITGNPDAVNSFRDVAWPAPKPEIAPLSSSNAFGGLFNNLSATLTIPAAPIITNPPIINPLASINLGAIASPWQHGIIPTATTAPFLQAPPPMIQNNYQSNQANNYQSRPAFNGANNINNNNLDRNRSNNNGGGSNWVRGNSQQMRRGTCFQFQKTGFCRKRNNGCPYIHER